jgi:hypothetical protein
VSRDLTRYERQPKRARTKTAEEAWWYANAGSIDVYTAKDGITLHARIKRSDLVRYIEKTNP